MCAFSRRFSWHGAAARGWDVWSCSQAPGLPWQAGGVGGERSADAAAAVLRRGLHAELQASSPSCGLTPKIHVGCPGLCGGHGRVGATCLGALRTCAHTDTCYTHAVGLDTRSVVDDLAFKVGAPVVDRQRWHDASARHTLRAVPHVYLRHKVVGFTVSVPWPATSKPTGRRVRGRSAKDAGLQRCPSHRCTGSPGSADKQTTVR